MSVPPFTFRVRVTPGAKVDNAGGTWGDDVDGPLAVRVSKRAVDGAANDALIGVLAEALDVRKRQLSIAAGPTSRVKTSAWMSRPPTSPFASKPSAADTNRRTCGSTAPLPTPERLTHRHLITSSSGRRPTGIADVPEGTWSGYPMAIAVLVRSPGPAPTISAAATAAASGKNVTGHDPSPRSSQARRMVWSMRPPSSSVSRPPRSWSSPRTMFTGAVARWAPWGASAARPRRIAVDVVTKSTHG